MNVAGVRPRVGAVDALLLLLVVIWGSNFSLVKAAIAEFPPFAFNWFRLVIASAVLTVPLRVMGATWPSRTDRRRLLALGLFGHCFYQVCFVAGLARTSAVNSALILGCMPVAVLIVNAVTADRESVSRRHWAGVGLSFTGVYLVVTAGSTLDRTALLGDLISIAALWCWAWYTVGSRPLLIRHTPLELTTYSMVIGTGFFLPFALPDLLRLEWTGVPAWSWFALVISAVLALSVAYVIWYLGVQRLGSARTSLNANLIPVTAMVVAAVVLDEPIGWGKIVGAGLILSGLGVARFN